MAKHPTSPGNPTQDHDPDDQFIAFVQQVTIWARANSRALIIAAIVLGIVVLAGIYYIDSQRRVEAEASTRFTQVQQSVLAGNVPLAIRDLQTFVATFSGTSAAREARILLADLLLSDNRPSEALDALGRLSADLDEPTGIAAAQLEAAAHEELGNTDEAIAVHQRVARDGRFEFQRREALAGAGRIALQNGRYDQAADFYDRLVQSLGEGEPDRTYYEMWRAEAQARAASPAAAVPATSPAEEPNG